MILRCTAKLLTLLDVRARQLPPLPPGDDDWYADLLWIERRKCLLLTHAGTLLSVFTADIRKADITPVGPFAIARITEALADERLPRTTLGTLDPDAVCLAATASRRVLGCMRNDAFMLENAVAMEGGLARADVLALNRDLRRTLHMSVDRRDGVWPLKEARQRASVRVGPESSDEAVPPRSAPVLRVLSGAPTALRQRPDGP